MAPGAVRDLAGMFPQGVWLSYIDYITMLPPSRNRHIARPRWFYTQRKYDKGIILCSYIPDGCVTGLLLVDMGWWAGSWMKN